MIIFYKRITARVLWSLSCLCLAIGVLSCASDPEENSGGGNNKKGGDKFSDVTATYYDVGEDCNSINEDEQYAPKDATELRRIIQRDMYQQGATVNLNYLDTSGITTMVDLFLSIGDTTEEATFNAVMNCWDVSGVKYMSNMFEGLTAFNGDITEWDVSQVIDMSGMFILASAFNQDISGWKVDNVTNMDDMFYEARAFNQNIGSWNVSKVTSMRAMFQDATAFNQDLTDWKNTIQATVTTESMFVGSGITETPDWREAGACLHHTAHDHVVENKDELQEKLNTLMTVDVPSPDLNHLETCNVKNMSSLFWTQTVFNGDVTGWNVSSVEDMRLMFSNAYDFDQDLSSWDVGKVKNMSAMFGNAISFNQDISGWNVGSVTTTQGMFSGAKAFDQDISGWNVGSVTTMRGMFSFAEEFDQDLSGWGDTIQASVVTDNIFNGSKITTLPDWKKAGVCLNHTAHENVVENRDELITKVHALIDSDPLQSLNHLETCNVGSMAGLFSEETTFNGDITGWDVSNVIAMGEIFKNAKAFNQDISGWDVGKLKYSESMFHGASAFNQDISGWNMSAVLDMGSMFEGAVAFNQDISGWDVGKLIHSDKMFHGASAFNQDISGWNVSNVTNMENMFSNASSFCNGDKSFESWGTKVVETAKIADMFKDADPDNSCTHVPPAWYTERTADNSGD